MTAGISFDLVAGGAMRFEEGTFRLPGGEWPVLVVSTRPVAVPEANMASWDSGAFGTFSADARLDRAAVNLLLGETPGVSGWVEVRGPEVQPAVSECLGGFAPGL